MSKAGLMTNSWVFLEMAMCLTVTTQLKCGYWRRFGWKERWRRKTTKWYQKLVEHKVWGSKRRTKKIYWWFEKSFGIHFGIFGFGICPVCCKIWNLVVAKNFHTNQCLFLLSKIFWKYRALEETKRVKTLEMTTVVFRQPTRWMIMKFGLMHTDGFYGPMITIKFFENHILPKILFHWEVLFLS